MSITTFFKSLSLVTAGATLMTLGLSREALAGSFIKDNFTRTGLSESITAPFRSPSTSTVNEYGGLVEIVVSGTGFSLAQDINDAFYGVPSGNPLDSQFYQLNIGYDGQPLFPFVGESRNINNFITFIDGIGFVNSPATPPYAVDNIYNFVVSLPSDAGSLRFGVSDGNFSDNGGQYNIDVYQLEAKQPTESVPEPSSVISLLALGTLGGASTLQYRWSKQS